MSDFRADLHCHSLFSDGTDTPKELIENAIASGLSGLSITDHDTIVAYEEAFDVAEARQFPLINGVEFSASYQGESVHILCYAFDMKSSHIASFCQRHKQRREQRNVKIVDNLKKLGIALDVTDCSVFKYHGSWGRPHIANLLMQKGIVSSIQEAFHLYLGEGKAAYEPGEIFSVEETIEIIKKGRGKAVLAHPHLLKRSTTIRGMLKMPFDGLECYYAKLSPGQEKKWIDLATQRKWLITGGSDYHGSMKPYNPLGSSWVPQETFERLLTHFQSVNQIS